MVYTETTQYIPRGLSGVIRCHVQANPPVQFVTWMKDKRALDLFGSEGLMESNGTILIDKVSSEHEGEYVCTPYNLQVKQTCAEVKKVARGRSRVFKFSMCIGRRNK